MTTEKPREDVEERLSLSKVNDNPLLISNEEADKPFKRLWIQVNQKVPKNYAYRYIYASDPFANSYNHKNVIRERPSDDELFQILTTCGTNRVYEAYKKMMKDKIQINKKDLYGIIGIIDVMEFI